MTAPTLTDPHPDPARRWVLLTRDVRAYLESPASSGLNDRRTFASDVEAFAQPSTELEFTYRLAELRDYALDACTYRGGSDDPEDTEAFLTEFGLDVPDDLTESDDDDDDDDPPVTRKYVTVQATIRFTITNTESDDYTENDVARYLAINVTGNSVDDFEGADVEIDSVDVEIDDDY